MPVGRPDFWYGLILSLTDAPTDGEILQAPTANWAYDHEHNASAHHTRYADAEAVAAMGAKANSNPLNHDRYTNAEALAALAPVAPHTSNTHVGIGSTQAYQLTAGRRYVTIEGASLAGVVELATAQADSDGVGVGFIQFTDKNSTSTDKRVVAMSGALSGTTGNKRGGKYTVFTKANNAEALSVRLTIDQDGTVDIPGNLTITGTVDGVDISAHAANASAHHTRYTDAEAQAAVLPVYIDRGDPSAYDKTQATMTADNAWHDWDVSAIVPSGAKSVLLYVYIQNTGVAEQMAFQKNGNVNGYNVTTIVQTVANLIITATLICAIDSNRVLEYRLTNSATWSAIGVLIGGWWK